VCNHPDDSLHHADPQAFGETPLSSNPHPVLHERDPIPWLPLPSWIEDALIAAARLVIKAAIAHVVQGVNSGKSDLQPPNR